MTGSPLPEGLFATPVSTYLDTASYGIAPIATIQAIREALRSWSVGEAKWFVDWDPVGEDCRRLIASIVGVDTASVALVPAVSVGVSIVASGFDRGAEVLVADDEFNSVLLPLTAAARERGINLRRVPFHRLADELSPATALVAVSHVRSNGGGTLDVGTLVEAARRCSAAVLLDATHSAGVRVVDADRLGIDFVVGAAYKHLLCPRGASFLTVSEPWRERLVPRSASWRAQADPYAPGYGGDLDVLAATAARFDVSLDWHAWVGARTSLRLLDAIPTPTRQAYCVGLTTAFAEGLGIPPTGSTVVGVPYTGDRATVTQRLDEEKIRVTVGEETLRVSFHLYNDETDVERGLDAIRPLLSAPAT